MGHDHDHDHDHGHSHDHGHDHGHGGHSHAPAAPAALKMAPSTALSLTPAAQAKVRAFLAEEENPATKNLRVAVEGGGCAGFQYALTIDEKRADDQVFAQEGFNVVVDPQSLMYLKGIRVDFVESLAGAGFKIENPNAKGGCGCGSSFSA